MLTIVSVSFHLLEGRVEVTHIVSCLLRSFPLFGLNTTQRRWKHVIEDTQGYLQAAKAMARGHWCEPTTKSHQEHPGGG